MSQYTYWIIYIAVGMVYALKTVEASANASFEIIQQSPELAQYSWLVNPFFFL